MCESRQEGATLTQPGAASTRERMGPLTDGRHVPVSSPRSPTPVADAPSARGTPEKQHTRTVNEQPVQ
eukprot:1716395-Rhodomonas_salina.3